MPQKVDTTTRAIVAGLLTWVMPGAGHLWLGQRGLALVFWIAISVPFLSGVAIGGVMNSVNPRTNGWLFLAEMGVSGYTLPFYFVGQAVERDIVSRQRAGENVDLTDYVAFYPESDVAQIYLATAGLLNLLAILDAIARAQTGLPAFQRELLIAEAEGRSP